MVRRLFGKVMWLGRATSALVGLVVLFALAIGAANSALAHTKVDNKLFHLGHANRVGTATTPGTPTALVSTLSDAVKSALVVQNKSGGPALSLGVLDGKAPMTVNASAGTATNLSSDELDGRDSADFQRRVSGQCAAGSSIQTIGADGAVTCEQDDDSGAAQVNQLKSDLGANDGTPNQPSDLVSFSKVKDVPGDVITRNADTLDSLNSTDFQRSNAPAGGDLTGNYPYPLLANGAVRGGPGGEIADESITSADINEHGVTSMDILNDTIESGDIATGGVGSAEVANGGLDLVDVAEWRGTASFDPPAVPVGSCDVADMQIPNIDPGDFAIVTPPTTLENGLLAFPGQSSAGGLLPVRLCNVTTLSAIDPGQRAWNYIIFDDGDDV